MNKNYENLKKQKCDCNNNCDCGNNCDCKNDTEKQKCDCGNSCKDNAENICENEDEILVSLCEDNDDKNDALKRRADEMTYQAQRIQAEFDNYRRRNAELNKQIKEDGRIEVIQKILPALDAFNGATKLITDQSTLQGIGMIFDRIMQSLSQFGLSKIEALNKDFDPNFHEAVMTKQDDNAKSGTVIEVLQDGYMINGKTLRPAMVITVS